MTISHSPARSGVAGPWLARLRQPTTRTWLLYFPFCFVSSVLAVAAFDARQPGWSGGNASGLALLSWFIGLAAAASLHWRRQFPETVVLLTAVAGLVLPLDPVAALIALGSLLVRRVDRMTAALTGLVTLTTFAATWRDSRGTTLDGSFWQMVFARPKVVSFEPMPWWVVALITVALMGLSVGLALLIRARSSLTRAEHTVQEQRAVVDHLHDEVSRRDERERLAQEVHDALGHRLSLLSLHAGALEVTASDNPRVLESAALVRANAQQSMADLRSLLAMLRQPDAPDVVAAVPTMRDVPDLIDETVATGVALVSTVQIEGVNRLDDTTSRSAFRITQELLTNARRHAPDIGVRVMVRAAPEVGVVIEVANHLPPHTRVEFVPGSGLDGIRNRVLALGGDFRCVVDGQRVFRVALRMPWRWASDLQQPFVGTSEEDR